MKNTIEFRFSIQKGHVKGKWRFPCEFYKSSSSPPFSPPTQGFHARES